MTFGTHIHRAQRKVLNDFGNPLTFYLAPPAGQYLHLSSEMSLHLLYTLAQHFVQTFTVHRG